MKSLAKQLWLDLPLVNFGLYAAAIAHAELANLTEARPDYVVTMVFPLVVPASFALLRFRAGRALAAKSALLVLLVPPALVGLTAWSGMRAVIPNDDLRDIYEVSAIGNTLVLLVHAGFQSRRLAVFLCGPAFVYGLLLENGGIWLGFFDELNYRLYLGPLPAPLATMSGWVMVFYLVLWITWEVRGHLSVIKNSIGASAVVAVCAGLLLDLQIDPLATAVGFWRWNTLLPEGPWGVPMVNFAAWSCAIFPFAWLVFYREAGQDLKPTEVAARPHRSWMWPRIPAVLGVAAVLFLSCMAMWEWGLNGPTYQILQRAIATYL